MSAFIVILGFTAFNLYNGQQYGLQERDLLMKNVEALMSDEFSTETTWSCSETPLAVKCASQCAVCGTNISSSDVLSFQCILLQ